MVQKQAIHHGHKKVPTNLCSYLR